MGGLFSSPKAPDTSELDKRNAEIDKKSKETEAANKAQGNRAAERRFKQNKGRRSLITTGEEGLPDNLG